MLYANQKELKSGLAESDKSALKFVSIQTSLHLFLKFFLMNNLISSMLIFMVFTKFKQEMLSSYMALMSFFSRHYPNNFYLKATDFLTAPSINPAFVDKYLTLLLLFSGGTINKEIYGLIPSQEKRTSNLYGNALQTNSKCT